MRSGVQEVKGTTNTHTNLSGKYFHLFSQGGHMITVLVIHNLPLTFGQQQ
jgi:hypothetical protein